MPRRVRLILVGDWGTGLLRAQKVAAQMRKEIEARSRAGLTQRVIHLGDVYYSGWGHEYRRRFLPLWPVLPEETGRIGSWSPKWHHDMSSGKGGSKSVRRIWSSTHDEPAAARPRVKLAVTCTLSTRLHTISVACGNIHTHWMYYRPRKAVRCYSQEPSLPLSRHLRLESECPATYRVCRSVRRRSSPRLYRYVTLAHWIDSRLLTQRTGRRVISEVDLHDRT
jgi:hypothetical protein